MTHDHDRRELAKIRQLSARQSWTYRQLIDLYGMDRATAIMEGRDLATNLDLARWNNLGEPK